MPEPAPSAPPPSSLYRWTRGPAGGYRAHHVWLQPTYATGLEPPGLLIDWLSDDRGAWWALVLRLRDPTPATDNAVRTTITELVPADRVRRAATINPPGPNSTGARITASTRFAWVRRPHSSSYVAGLVLGRAIEPPGKPVTLVACIPDVALQESAEVFWAGADRVGAADR